MHKTAYDMRISDWSSVVCSSDLGESFCQSRGETKRLVLFADHNVQSGREFGTSRRQCFGEALKLLIDAVRFLFECVRDDTGGELALLAQFLELADRHVEAIRDRLREAQRVFADRLELVAGDRKSTRLNSTH